MISVDKVNGLTYIIREGNTNNIFSTSRNGDIRLNGQLDYEDPNQQKVRAACNIDIKSISICLHSIYLKLLVSSHRVD